MTDSKKVFFIVAIVCLVMSVMALFIPVIWYKYTPEEGKKGNAIDTSYSVAGLIVNAEEFSADVLFYYQGPVVWDIDGLVVFVLASIYIIGIICAGFGVVTLRAQRPNTWQFILTIAGLVLVAVPSIIMMICVFGYGQYFPGKMTVGPAPILTIISMIICICAVIRRKNKVAEELRKELESKGLIRKGGSLL